MAHQRRAAAVSRVQAVDCRVSEAVKHFEEFVEVCASVVVDTDLAGTVEVVSLHRMGAGDHSGIGAERLAHQVVETVEAVRKVGCWDIEAFQEMGISATVVGTTVAAVGRAWEADHMVVGTKSMLS